MYHIYGKANDPDNAHLVVLCFSCHVIVGKFAYSKCLVNDPEAWERLIQFAWMEANGATAMTAELRYGIYTCVKIEFQPPDEGWEPPALGEQPRLEAIVEPLPQTERSSVQLQYCPAMALRGD